MVDDSPRYLGYADNMLKQGFYFDPHEFWYIGYTGFIMLFKMLGLSLQWVVLTQYILSFIAVICIYMAALQLFNSHSSALIAALLYLGFFEICLYSAYILCEANLVSLTTISLYFITLWHKGKSNIWNILLGSIVILLASLTKPTGVAIITALLVWVVFKANQKISSKSLKMAIVSILLIPFLFLINKMLTPFGFMNDYSRGELIFGMFQYPNSPHYDLLTIDKPSPMYFPDESYPAILRLSLFILHHPIYWLKLFFGKITLLFLHIRPFWSIGHNLFSLAFLLPTYYFFIKSIREEKIISEVKVFVLAFITFHALSVGMLTDDWDGRFLIPVLPIIFLFASSKMKDIIFKAKENLVINSI